MTINVTILNTYSPKGVVKVTPYDTKTGEKYEHSIVEIVGGQFAQHLMVCEGRGLMIEEVTMNREG